MSIHAAAPARHASLRQRRGWASTAFTDLTEQALAAVVVCVTVAYVLHAAPSSLRVQTADASGSHQQSFSIETVTGSRSTVCESTSDVPTDGTAGVGACRIDLFSTALLAPGSTETTRIRIGGTGSQPITALSLRPLTACRQHATATATDFCQQIHLRIACGSRVAFDGSAAELGGRTHTPIPLISGRADRALVLTTVVSLPRTLGNSYQALNAVLPLLLTTSA